MCSQDRNIIRLDKNCTLGFYSSLIVWISDFLFSQTRLLHFGFLINWCYLTDLWNFSTIQFLLISSVMCISIWSVWCIHKFERKRKKIEYGRDPSLSTNSGLFYFNKIVVTALAELVLDKEVVTFLKNKPPTSYRNDSC